MKESQFKKDAQIQKQLNKNFKAVNSSIKKSLGLSKAASSKADSTRLKVTPLTTKAKTKDFFKFGEAESESITLRTEKNNTSNDSSISGSKNKSSANIDYDMRNNSSSAKIKVQGLKEPVQFSQELLSLMIKFWRKNSTFVRSSGNFEVKELDRI